MQGATQIEASPWPLRNFFTLMEAPSGFGIIFGGAYIRNYMVVCKLLALLCLFFWGGAAPIHYVQAAILSLLHP